VLFFDPRDRDHAPDRIGWLEEIGARPVGQARPFDAAYVFAGDRGMDDYRALVAGRPLLSDPPLQRADLQDLGRVLARLPGIPTPRTWRLEIDTPLPDDLAFPLFVRTARRSWKLGGPISRVRTPRALETEAQELRRAFGWNASILAREWVNFAPAGGWRRGRIPREIRVWIVDREPFAWSFHHMHVVPEPVGFPPSDGDLATIRAHAAAVGRALESRLIAADFAPDVDGRWWLIEADNGSPAGTAHESVYKAVARRLEGESTRECGDWLGGLL
jgi:hypothetical protein